MHGLFVERYLLEGKSLSWHIALHICAHGQSGKIAVVANRPEVLLATTRKQWLLLLRRSKNERSGTLSPARKHMLDERILWMENLSFTCKPPDDLLEADITFATADDFVRIPPVCGRVYVTYEFEREKLYMLTAWMPRNSLVVVCE